MTKYGLSALVVFAITMSAQVVEDLTPGAFDKTPPGKVVSSLAGALKEVAAAAAPASNGGRVVTEHEVGGILEHVLEDLVDVLEELPTSAHPWAVDLRVALALRLASTAASWAAVNSESNEVEALANAMKEIAADVAEAISTTGLSPNTLRAALVTAIATLRAAGAGKSS